MKQNPLSVTPTQRAPACEFKEVLSAKYRRKCASRIGDPGTYLRPKNEIETLSLLCDTDIRDTTDDQSGYVGPYVLVAVGGP